MTNTHSLAEPADLANLYNNSYSRPPHWLSNLRAKIYLKQILLEIAIQSHYHVLEVGCDRGQLTELLRRHSRSVIGIDVNPAIIGNSGKSYMQLMDATKLNFPDSCFDLVISSNTIEHIPDIQTSLREMVRVLKPGGYMALIYPWEPIRGWTVLPEAIFQHRSLIVCRQFHVHNFTPQQIGSLINNLSIVQLKWKVFFVPHPNFISIIKKI